MRRTPPFSLKPIIFLCLLTGGGLLWASEEKGALIPREEMTGIFCFSKEKVTPLSPRASSLLSSSLEDLKGTSPSPFSPSAFTFAAPSGSSSPKKKPSRKVPTFPEFSNHGSNPIPIMALNSPVLLRKKCSLEGKGPLLGFTPTFAYERRGQGGEEIFSCSLPKMPFMGEKEQEKGDKDYVPLFLGPYTIGLLRKNLTKLFGDKKYLKTEIMGRVEVIEEETKNFFDHMGEGEEGKKIILLKKQPLNLYGFKESLDLLEEQSPFFIIGERVADTLVSGIEPHFLKEEENRRIFKLGLGEVLLQNIFKEWSPLSKDIFLKFLKREEMGDKKKQRLDTFLRDKGCLFVTHEGTGLLRFKRFLKDPQDVSFEGAFPKKEEVFKASQRLLAWILCRQATCQDFYLFEKRCTLVFCSSFSA